MALLATTRTIVMLPPTDRLKHKHIVFEAETEPSPQVESEDQTLPDHIISSPYTDCTHQLDLRTLSLPVSRFARALRSLRNTRPDYATAPYDESFNWCEIVKRFAERSEESISFHVIVFRSQSKEDANRTLLGELDKAAHLEAARAGGLLKYWFGSPDHDRRNLATCLWRARDDARLGGAGPGHAAAMLAAREMYDEWFVERLKLIVHARTSKWEFEPWSD